MSSEHKFKYYDAVQLISLVKEHPCIWNRNIDAYKDKFERKNAWEEIFTIMEPDYNSMSSSDKRHTEVQIQKRWWNIRDNFKKSLRDHNKNYVHRKHMLFLLEGQVMKEDDDFPLIEYLDEDAAYITAARISPSRKRKRRENNDFKMKRLKKERNSNDSEFDTTNFADEFNFVDIDDSKSAKNDMTEDQAFFASLVPTVAKYNEDDKLEFRLGVLNLMKEIRTKNKMANEEEFHLAGN